MSKDKKDRNKNGEQKDTEAKAPEAPATTVDLDAQAEATKKAALSLVAEKENDPEYQAKLAAEKEEYNTLHEFQSTKLTRRDELKKLIAAAKTSIRRSVSEAERISTAADLETVVKAKERVALKNKELTNEVDQLEAEYAQLAEVQAKIKEGKPATTASGAVRTGGSIGQAKAALRRALMTDGFAATDSEAVLGNTRIAFEADTWTMLKDEAPLLSGAYGRGAIDKIRAAM